MGKIILVVLLVVVVIAILLFFYPFSYTIKAEGHEGKYKIVLDIYGLFGFIHLVREIADMHIYSRTKILGITINKKSKKIDLFKKMRKRKAARKHIKNARVKKKARTTAEYIRICIKKAKRKIKKWVQIVKDFITNFKSKSKELLDKESVLASKDIIFSVLKHIRPRKVTCNIHFGFSKPHLTGQTLGWIAMACEMFRIDPKKLKIRPDFENKVFEGNIKIKGHFLLFRVLIYNSKSRKNVITNTVLNMLSGKEA